MYGSEFGIEGKKERYSDDSLRPMLSLEDYKDAKDSNACTRLISRLGEVRQKVKALSYGDYKELVLTNRQYGFARNFDGESVLVAVNNDENEVSMSLPAGSAAQYRELLSGQTMPVANGSINVQIPTNSGGIWVPVHTDAKEEPVKVEAIKSVEPVLPKQIVIKEQKPEASPEPTEPKREAAAEEKEAKPKTYEEMSVEELQQAILARMAKNGPITDRMRQDVMENVWHDSLVNWIKSFR